MLLVVSSTSGKTADRPSLHQHGLPWALLALLLATAEFAWAQTGPVVKVYPCPTGTAQSTADRLRAEFGAVPGVRIAADERTSQVITQAPPDVQAQISQRLATPMSAPAGASQSRSIALHRKTPEEFEAALWATLGNRLSAVPGAGPQERRYRLSLVGGASIELTIQSAAKQVTIQGLPAAVEASARLVQILDGPGDSGGRSTRVVAVRAARPASVERAAAALGPTTTGARPAAAMLTGLFQAQAPAAGATPPAPNAPPPSAPAGPKPGEPKRSGLVSPVQVEMLEGLDVIVIRGNRQDVDQVVDIVNQIERLSVETEPAIEVCRLRHADCQTLGILLRSLYDEVYLLRQGAVSITPLVKPNAILVVGRKENVQTVVDLVNKLDEPVAPDTQFQVFLLRHASVTSVQVTVQQFYMDRGGLGPLVRTAIDIRANALVVQACPRDMAEVTEMIRRLDTPTSEAVNEMRIVQLEHSMAQDLAVILQSAIGAATGTMGAGRQVPGMPGLGGMQGLGAMQQQAAGQQVPGLGAAGQMRPGTDQRSVMLRFLTIDAKGRRLLSSGILSDVRITADVRANALVISAPAESMDLIEALVRQLDKLPAAEAQIKVFTIVNGDAANLADMLRMLFATQLTAGAQQPMMMTAVSGSENSVVALRFAVDTRTNSIIASGSMGDLNVVEAILTRLDDGEVRHRRSVVFRLKNSPAIQVATTINQFLTTERQFQQATPGLTSAFEQIEREVVVVPEPVSNSLVLSATPRFFEEVKTIIEQLDARPPMVMIQVLIASIQLGETNEFGVELGLQDSVLFDRSILSNLQTTSVVNQGVTTQQVVSANGSPGFNFNNGDPLGNVGSVPGSAINSHPSVVGPQALSNFSVGRSNGPLGYGGLVLSAASENVSVLLRALAENHRVEILQRPQIMTLDNQPAFIQVGQRVPRVTGVSSNTLAGQTNTIVLENVGLILGVTPRISPDGLVVMQIDAERSELGPEATGIPITTSPTGQVIRSPIIDATTAQTTVSALSNQTVVLGGLIARTKNEFHRKVPLLGDIPVLGHLFRYDGTSCDKRELLIIMTPHIVKNEADAEAIKRAEAARMSWCLRDVTAIHGEAGLRRRTDEWTDSETVVIYPDLKPQPAALPALDDMERVPAPAGTPVAPMPESVRPREPQGSSPAMGQPGRER